MRITDVTICSICFDLPGAYHILLATHDVVRSLEDNVIVLLCKLEKIFPPGFFNVM